MERPKNSTNKRPQHKWSKEEVKYLKEITPGHSYKEIHKLMNDKFEYEFTIEQVKGAISRYKLKTGLTGEFRKGFVPWNKGLKGYMGANKTSFKKGNIPQQYRPIGSERLTKDGYIEIKIADPNRWELKHRVIYEKHFGLIEKGNAIIFLDKDKNNFNIDNLKCVTREQLLVLNKNNLIMNNSELTNIGINVVDLIIKTNKVKKRKK